MELLRNPYNLWASGGVLRQRKAIKLAFKGQLSYQLKEEFRTPAIAEPLRLCCQLKQGNYEMVPTAGIELATY